jgi:DUF3103 family protein
VIQVLRTALATAATFAALTLVTSTAEAIPAAPSSASSAVPSASQGTVFTITDQLAKQVAGDLTDRTVRDRVVSATASGSADLLAVAPGSTLARQAMTANGAVLTAKALPATSGSMLRLRLANPDARAALAGGAVPLVAAAPTDDQPTAVTAYGPNGEEVTLDAFHAPQRPVLVVEVDVAKALPIGLKLMRQTLAGHGITGARPAAAKSLAAGGYWATKIDSIRLTDDEEPWVKGEAEIYSVVGGWGLDGNPAVDIVQMPYLDNDNTTYFPNQLIVQFKSYEYDLADVVMMEDDGDTNYQSLAQAIAGALLTLTDNGAYTPLVNAILSAIPSSWWTDDPDFVDSWYTLATTSSGTLRGAGDNGTMTVEPYWVPAI